MRREFNLKGSIAALVTPFSSNGNIDYSALDRLIDFHLENGTDGMQCNIMSKDLSISRFIRAKTFWLVPWFYGALLAVFQLNLEAELIKTGVLNTVSQL